MRKFYESVLENNVNSIIKGEQDVPICGYRNMDCFNKVMMVFEDTTNSKTVADCKCLPSCYLLEYDIDVVQSTIKRNYTNQLRSCCNIEYSDYLTSLQLQRR